MKKHKETGRHAKKVDAPGDQVEARLHFSPIKSKTMDIKGYCTIKESAEGRYVADVKKWKEALYCRVMDYNIDGDVLALLPDGKTMGMFNKNEVESFFPCVVFGNVLCPPDADFAVQMVYYHKVISRKGGYNDLLKRMVILASLRKGKLDDEFLFSIERMEQQQQHQTQPRV